MSEVSLHKNGSGRIVGILAAVGSDCYLSPDSQVEGTSSVSYQSSIFSSRVSDSDIAITSIERSVIVKSRVAGAYVGDAALERVIVRGTVEKKADVQDVSLSDVVVEACKLRNVELNGPYLLHSDWNETPRHFLLESDNGVAMALIECGNDRFHAGCKCRSFAEWDAKEYLLRRYFLRRGWPAETFDTIRVIFESWR